jgi:hypothetical protein
VVLRPGEASRTRKLSLTSETNSIEAERVNAINVKSMLQKARDLQVSGGGLPAPGTERKRQVHSSLLKQESLRFVHNIKQSKVSLEDVPSQASARVDKKRTTMLLGPPLKMIQASKRDRS